MPTTCLVLEVQEGESGKLLKIEEAPIEDVYKACKVKGHSFKYGGFTIW